MLVSFAARHEGRRAGDNADAARRAVFAERLKAAMGRKGWGLSETARRASQVLGPGAKFGRAHVWHYLHGRAVPRARQLDALSRALDVEPDDLLGSAPEARGEAAASTVRAHDQGDGTVFLEVVQRVSWETALEILRVLQTTSSRSRDRG